MPVWWGSEVDASRHRPTRAGAALDVQALSIAVERLTQLADGWHEVEPGEIVRESALRFLRVHPLPAADALQLAAAFVVGERRPSSLQIVALDERLADAARKEGFALIGVTDS